MKTKALASRFHVFLAGVSRSYSSYFLPTSSFLLHVRVGGLDELRVENGAELVQLVERERLFVDQAIHQV